MAIELKFSICITNNCKAINFREITGIYDASTNTGGWGDADKISNAESPISLIVTTPGGITYPSFDLAPLGFPTDNAYLPKEIKASDIDSTLTTFVDGFWKFTYAVKTSVGSYTQTKTFFFYCSIKKQVNALIADLRLSDCTCDSEKVLRASQMTSYLSALEYAVGLGDTVSANEIYTALQRLINCSICK